MSTDTQELDLTIIGQTEIRRMVEFCDCADCTTSRAYFDRTGHAMPGSADYCCEATFTVEIKTTYTTTVIECLNSVHADAMFCALEQSSSIMDKESLDEPEDYAGQTVGEAIVKIEAAKDDSLFKGFATLTALHANLDL